MTPSWTASYALSTVVRALDKAVGVPRSTQVHCSGVDLTEVRFPPVGSQPWAVAVRGRDVFPKRVTSPHTKCFQGSQARPFHS